MSGVRSRNSPSVSRIPTSHAEMILRAEKDHYDCLTQFGCNSAEAYASEVIWRRLRSQGGRGGARAP